jgi:hypothetical protein
MRICIMYLVHVRTSRYVLWNTFKPKKWEKTQTSRKLPSEGHHNLCCSPNIIIIIIILYFCCCATVLIVSRPHKIKMDTHYADVTWDHVTSDAVSRVGSLQLSAECSNCSHVTW